MARVSSVTGLGLADLGELSESQLAAVFDVARDEQRRRQWSQDTELLACAVEVLRHIADRLDAGVPVALVAKTEQLPNQPPIPRPDWVVPPSGAAAAESAAAPSDVVVMTPREFVARYAPGR